MAIDQKMNAGSGWMERLLLRGVCYAYVGNTHSGRPFNTSLQVPEQYGTSYALLPIFLPLLVAGPPCAVTPHVYHAASSFFSCQQLADCYVSATINLITIEEHV